MKKWAALVLILILAMACACFAGAEGAPSTAGQSGSLPMVRGRVAEVLSDETVTTDYSGGQMRSRVLTLRVELLEGAFRGEIIKATQTFDEIGMASSYPAKVGDRLFVGLELDDGNGLRGYCADYVRDVPIYWMAAGFALFLLLFGREKGLKTLLSLGLTVAAVFCFFFPAVIRGASPVWCAVITCIFSTVATLLLVCGWNKKALAAAVGCLGGLAVAGALTALFGYWMRISGIVDEEAAFLMFISDEFLLDFKGVLLAASIIGALGATMDVSVSIASALTEIREKAPELTPRELIHSGVAIGRDIMGTMANTLVLAYVGGSIHIVLLLYAYPVAWSSIINRETVAAQMLITLSGSMGMFCSIPITTLFDAALAYFDGRKPPSEQRAPDGEGDGAPEM
ncbi:MAG: YibE/F family protein [Oscillospiraceae bacterium]|nr:YibE/F family protein [Oscillospiraceae bacterium]